MTFEEAKQRIDDLLGIVGTITDERKIGGTPKIRRMTLAYRSPTGIPLLEVLLAEYEGSPSGWVLGSFGAYPEVKQGIHQILGM